MTQVLFLPRERLQRLLDALNQTFGSCVGPRVRDGVDHSDDELRLHSEMVIRNYDPCISCATHFLRLKTERS